MVDKLWRITSLVKFLSVSSLLLLLLPAGGNAGTPRPPAPPAPPAPVAARAPEHHTPPPDAPEADEEEARPKRAWLGVVLSEDEDGIGVTGVKDGSPAEKAGLKEGDKIMEIDSKKVHDADDIRHTIRALEPGDTIQVVVMRDGRKKTVTATLAEAPHSMWSGEGFHGFGPNGDFPGMHMGMFSRNYLGVRVQGMTEELRAYFRAPRGRGVLVSRVEEDTPAGKAGLRAGDVIISVDGKGIADRGDIGQALADKEPGDTVAVRIVRDGSEKTLDVEIAERPAAKRRGAMMWGEEPFMEDNDGDADHDFEVIEEGLPEDSRIEIERALRQAHQAMSRQEIQRQIEAAVEQAREAVAQHRQEIQKEIEEAMRQSELARVDQEEVGRQVKRAMEMAREQMQRALEAAEQARQEEGISL